MSNPNHEFVVKNAGCAPHHEKDWAEIHVLTEDDKTVTLKINAAELTRLQKEISAAMQRFIPNKAP